MDTLQLRGATASHVGNVREVNQDRAHFGGYLAVVADGMGGHQGGEMAASIAISEFTRVNEPIGPGGLVALVEEANRAVYEKAADPDLRGMGTTLVALTLRPTEGKVSVVNVGDSRAYFLRGDEFGQLTLDHSLVEDLVRQNRITPEQALNHPNRNILTRAVGIASEVEVDSFLVSTKLGDRFLLCSDGLFNEVPEEEIVRILKDNPLPNEAADLLVEAALAEAGRDNITVAVVDVVAEGDGGNLSTNAAETLLVPSISSSEAPTIEVEITDNGGEVDEGVVEEAGHAVEAAADLDAPSGESLEEPGYDGANGYGGAEAPVADELAAAEQAHAVMVEDAPTGGLDPEYDELEIDTDEQPQITPIEPRRQGRRVIIGIVAAAVLVGVAVFGFRTWVYGSYYVDVVADDDGISQVVVQNGRRTFADLPFFGATQVDSTDATAPLDEFTDAAQTQIDDSGPFGSAADAQQFIADLERVDPSDVLDNLEDTTAEDGAADDGSAEGEAGEDGAPKEADPTTADSAEREQPPEESVPPAQASDDEGDESNGQSVITAP